MFFSACFFGGGIKKGFLYGQTADERPLITTKNPVTINDLHTTIFTAMGISPKTALRCGEAAVLRDARRQRPAGQRAVRERVSGSLGCVTGKRLLSQD